MTSDLPKITLRYAYSTPYGNGPTWDSPHEARSEQPDARDSGALLLRLFVHPNGKVIHSEIVS